MNDCIWRVLGVCYSKCRCEKYLSMNSEEGKKAEQAYTLEWNRKVKPIQNRLAINFYKNYYKESK